MKWNEVVWCSLCKKYVGKYCNWRLEPFKSGGGTPFLRKALCFYWEMGPFLMPKKVPLVPAVPVAVRLHWCLHRRKVLRARRVQQVQCPRPRRVQLPAKECHESPGSSWKVADPKNFNMVVRCYELWVMTVMHTWCLKMLRVFTTAVLPCLCEVSERLRLSGVTVRFCVS